MKENSINGFYLLVLIMLGALLFVNVRYFKGSGYSSVGLTYGNDYKLNAERASFVRAIHVVPGQQIKAGDLLIELSSSDLDIEIGKLVNRIDVLRSEQIEKVKLSSSDIAYMRAEQQIEIEKINSELLEAEGELRLNQQLTNNFTNSKDTANPADPIRVRINALRQQKRMLEEATNIKSTAIAQGDRTERGLLANQIVLLEKELDVLRNERQNLKKFAAGDGVVGRVFVTSGEQIEAFTPLLSINPVHPVSVTAYLVGNKKELPVGASVDVQSFDHKMNSVSGKIIGYGAVVMLPEILQKSTAVKAFGREVFIEIDQQNNLATGEKVLIR
jgi:multidrug resistance efflux pump